MQCSYRPIRKRDRESERKRERERETERDIEKERMRDREREGHDRRSWTVYCPREYKHTYTV